MKECVFKLSHHETVETTNSSLFTFFNGFDGVLRLLYSFLNKLSIDVQRIDVIIAAANDSHGTYETELKFFLSRYKNEKKEQQKFSNKKV